MKQNVKRIKATNSKTTILAVILILVSITIIISSTFAYFMYTVRDTSDINFGAVQLSDETEVGISGKLTDILPGTMIIDNPIQFSRAANSEPFYVRAKVAFSLEEGLSDREKAIIIAYLDSLRHALDFDIYHEPQNGAFWSERDGNYFYLLNGDGFTLKAVDDMFTYKLCDEIMVPRSLDQAANHGQYMHGINFHVSFQAIQTLHVGTDIEDIKEMFDLVFPEPEEEKIHEGFTNATMIVSPQFITDGEVINYTGKEFVVGLTAFDTLQRALDHAVSFDEILLLPGTYQGNVTILKDNISILGSNAGIDPVTGVWSEKSTIIGGIRVNANNFTLNGVNQVIDNTSTVNRAIEIMKAGMTGLEVLNNVITDNRGVTSALIYAYNGGYTNFIIKNNWFNHAVRYSNASSIWIYGIKDITIENCTFETSFLYDYPTYTTWSGYGIRLESVSGDINVLRNDFSDYFTRTFSVYIYNVLTDTDEINVNYNKFGGGYITRGAGVSIDMITASSTCVILVQDNDFINVRSSTGMHAVQLRATDTTTARFVASVSNNNFINTTSNYINFEHYSVNYILFENNYTNSSFLFYTSTPTGYAMAENVIQREDEEYKVRFRAYLGSAEYQYWIRRVAVDSPTMLIPYFNESQNFVITSWIDLNDNEVEMRDTAIVLTELPFVNNITTVTSVYEEKKIDPGLLIILPSHSVRKKEIKTIDFGAATPTSMPELTLEDIGNDVCFTGKFFADKDCTIEYEFGKILSEEGEYVYAEMYDSRDLEYQEMEGYYLATVTAAAIGVSYIPSFHNDLPVKGVNAGSVNTTITSVVFANNIENIYNNAFKGFTALEGDILISENISSIGGNAFGDCDKITTFYIDSQSVLDSIIDRYSLGGAIELGVAELYINTQLTTNSLSQFLIDNTTKDVTQTYDYKSESYNLYRINDIPILYIKGLNDTIIDFYRVFKDEIISRPELGFEEIGNNICFTGEFYQEAEYTTLFEFGGTITEDTDVYPELLYSTVETANMMSDGRMDYIYSFSEELIIPSYYNGYAVTNFSSYSFYDTRQIISLVLPYGVTSLATSNMFRYATYLETIKAPRSIVTTLQNAFTYTNYYNDRTNTDNWINNRLYLNLGSIGKAIVYDLNTTTLTELTADDFEDIVLIGGRAFYSHSYLETVTLSDDVRIIDTYAFYNCSLLKTVELNDYITTIGTYAFRNCYQLASINLSESLIDIGTYAFYGDTALTTITIPENVTTIGSAAFTNCTNLTEVYIDSAEVLKGIISVDAMGGILSNTSNVYIRSDISEDDMSSYLTNGLYTKDESQTYTHDGKEYYKWSSVNIELTYQNGSVLYVQAKGSSVTSSMITDKTLLTGVVIPRGITTISSSTFEGCTLLSNVSLPDTLVTIGDYAFRSCSALTSLTLPNSITSIGIYAFSLCSKLTSIDLGDSIQTINNYAFQECSVLRTVDFGDSLVTLGTYAFNNCPTLQSVTLPSTVTSIGIRAFQNNTSLRTVDLSETKVATILDYTFFGCTMLNTVKLPNTVTTLALASFSGCTRLASINIASVVTINQDAFLNCTSLNNITLGENLTTIYSTTFSTCTSLTKLYVDSKSVLANLVNQSDYGYAFYNAVEIFTLTSISIGDMGSYMKSGLLVQEQGTWYENDGKAYYKWTPVQIKITYIGGIVKYVYAKGNTVSAASITSKPTIIAVEIPSGIRTIETGAFQGATNLTSVHFPTSLTTISSYAFQGCTSLINLQLPDSVTSIGSSAFANCTSLSLIKFPSNLTNLYSFVFQGCTSLENIDLPDNIRYIENSVFSGCTKLNNVVIPEMVTSIMSAFVGCTSLNNFYIDSYQLASRITDNYYLGNATAYIKNLYFRTDIADYQIGTLITSGLYTKDETQVYTYKGQTYNRWTPNTVTFIYEGDVEEVVDITGNTITSSMISSPTTLIGVIIPEGITSIAGAFQYCTKLTSVSFPSTLTTISDNAFRGCTGFTTFTIPDTVTSILSYAFANCTNLETINFGGVTTISSYAFQGCTKLVNVDASSVTSISSYAFMNCTGLESITMTSLRTIGTYAFQNCNKLNSVVIPSTVTSIGTNAFVSCIALKKVYIDSTSMATNITSATLPGYLIYYAEEIYILSTIADSSIGSYLRTGPYHKDTTQTYEYNGSTYNLWIPNTIDVTYEDGSTQKIKLTTSSIDSGIISNLSTVVSVVIPTGITTIGDSAFANATKLETVTFPEGLTTINLYAFQNCVALKSVSLPSTINTIMGYAFSGCTALETLEFKDCISLRIESAAFQNCSKIESIILPEGLTYIGSNAFSNCTSLKTVHFPSTLTSVATGSFRSCPIETMTIDEGNTRFKVEGNCLIMGNTQLYVGTSTSVIPDTVTSIAPYAFMYCTFETINIPESVTSISSSSFAYCTNLRFVIMNNANMSMTTSAFISSINLEGFILTSTTGTVTTYFNTLGEDIYYKGTQEEWNALTNASNITVNVYYYSEDSCVHESNKYWTYDENDLPVILEATIGEFTITSQPTCSEVGKMQATCNACRQDIVKDIPKVDHELVSGVCKYCGEEVSYVISYPTSYAFSYNEVSNTYTNSNQAVQSSTSSMTLTMQTAGILSFSYSVYSEANCDVLIVTKNGSEVLNKSGSISKTATTISVAVGDVIMIKYTKDGSVDSGTDTATIYDLIIL